MPRSPVPSRRVMMDLLRNAINPIGSAMANGIGSSHRWESLEAAQRSVGCTRVCIGSLLAMIGMLISSFGELSPVLGYTLLLICTVYTVRGLLEIKGVLGV